MPIANPILNVDGALAPTLFATPSDVLTIRVAGEPVGQPRVKARRLGKGADAPIRIYTPSDADPWKNAIARAARTVKPAAPLDGPLRVDVLLLFPRPLYLLKKKSPAGRLPHAQKPDRDNCDKAVLDALVSAGVIVDDKLVCDGGIVKRYVAIGEEPGAVIEIRQAV